MAVVIIQMTMSFKFIPNVKPFQPVNNSIFKERYILFYVNFLINWLHVKI